MEPATATKYSGEPNPVDTTGLCLLSLDGGGVRGLSTLYILKSIMDRLNHARADNKLQPVKPCEVFDLIGGTSTGGLIAIMLGRLEMDVDQCIAAYSDLAETVFGKKLSSLPFNFKGKVKSRFESAKLEAAVLKAIKRSGAAKDELFNDGMERGCRTFVCTADRDTKAIVRLRSYSLPHEPDIRATICQAALATSAATTFFDPVSIGARSFADGGLGANNPVDEVEGEASNIWCTDTGDLKPLIKCFISIGTGNPGKKAFEDSMTKFLSETVVHIATETENTERKFIARYAKLLDEKRYFRLNVEQGLQNIGLDEYKKKGAMEAATEDYITHKDRYFRVRDCIRNLSLKQNKPETSFAAVVNDYVVRDIRWQSEAMHRTSWIVPFERNQRFTGRESQLAQLNGMLFAKDHLTKVAIIGLGGVGKTQLVLELLFRTREKHPDCLIIWIPATSIEALHQAYLDAAQHLGIPGWEDARSDVKKLVQEHLAKQSTGRWLLVFDNADDMNMWVAKPEQGSQRLIDYLPKSQQGAILFTTRDRKVAVNLAQQNVVDVPAMGEDVAAELLEKCLIRPDLANGQDDTSALLSQLTYLPLAIVQAAAYINQNAISLADYLSLLAEQEEEVIDLLSEEFEDDSRYNDVKNPVATTWLVSFERIRQRDPLAADYLTFMACIEPKDIPQSLLPPGLSRKTEMEALGTLDAYSFISKRPVDQALDIHQLVHLATRNWLRKEGVLARAAENAIARLGEVFPDHHHTNRSVWRTYLPHVRFVLESDAADKDRGSKLSLMLRYAMCLDADGRWAEAEETDVQVIEIQKEKLGADHPDTLTSMANLAETYRYLGRLDDAEKIGVQVMEIQKEKLGADHPSTLTSMANLAVTYSEQGRQDEAEELKVQVIEIQKEKLGADHPDTLTSMANLAVTYSQQGRQDEAEELEVQVMEIRKEKLGADHPDTLTSMANLAVTYSQQGRQDEAEELEVQVMEIRKEKLGADHPDTLTSIANLAVTYSEQGREDKAEELEVQVMEIRKEKLGADHPDTLTSIANLAVTYSEQGREDEAEELEVQVMEIRKEKLGADHPDTLTSIANLAVTYSQQGREDKAEELEVQVMEIQKEKLGTDHPSTLTSMANLAYTWKGQGRDMEALSLMTECVHRQQQALGVNHPDCVSCRQVLVEWEAEEARASKSSPAAPAT